MLLCWGVLGWRIRWERFTSFNTADISLLSFFKKKKTGRTTRITARVTTYRNRWEKSSRFYLFVRSKQTCRLISSIPGSRPNRGCVTGSRHSRASPVPPRSQVLAAVLQRQEKGHNQRNKGQEVKLSPGTRTAAAGRPLLISPHPITNGK